MMSGTKSRGWLISFFVLALTVLLSSPDGVFAQDTQQKESQAESLLNQADESYAKGDYQKAIFTYLQAVPLTSNKMSLSRAYMGLSLCYFYLNETENAKKAMARLLEVEPQKEISPLFHPETFVELFNEVRREMGVQPSPEQPAVTPLQEQPAEKVEEPLPAQEAFALEEEKKGGTFEVEVHFSGWSIDPAKKFFEKDLKNRFSREIRDEVTKQLNGLHGGTLVRAEHKTEDDILSLDSEGSNYGFEIRYYPLGRRGSMSLGLSLEKTKIRVPIRGTVVQKYQDGSKATVETEGAIETSPFTTNLSFRWDFMPAWRVTPYLTFGVGVGPLAGEAKYVYVGTYENDGSPEMIQGDLTKTFDELREEGDIELDLILLVQLSLGVKGEIFKGITVKGEVGFWDGLLLRAGLAFRF